MTKRQREKMRQQIRVVIYEDLYIETNLSELIDTLTKFKNDNPGYDELYLDNDSYSDYYNERVNRYNIIGYRKETDEELDKRLELIDNAKKAQEAREKQLYEQLKTKFEK